MRVEIPDAKHRPKRGELPGSGSVAKRVARRSEEASAHVTKLVLVQGRQAHWYSLWTDVCRHIASAHPLSNIPGPGI